MRTIIFEHILFGALRPWLGAAEDSSLATPSGADPKNTSPLMLSLLQAHPEVAKELRQQPMSTANEDAERYVGLEPEVPYNRPSGWYKRLIELESARVFELALERVDRLDTDIDRQYEINSSIRQWVDLLAEAKDLYKVHEEKLSQYVLQLLQHSLMQLILDLSLRFPGADRYGVSALYVEVLDRPAPDKHPFYKTAACRSFQLKRLLKGERTGDTDFRALRSAMIADMQVAGKENRVHEYEQLIAHLENALFLQAMNAPFIGPEPEKLLDARYCREWIQGIRRDFMAERDPEEAARIFCDLLDAGEAFERLLPPDEALPVEKSAARQLVTALQDIYSFRLGATVPANSEDAAETVTGASSEADTDFGTSFNKRFITIDAFDAVLPGTREATLRYIRNADIRVLEISREVKFLYREDVENFLDENTV